MHAMTLPALSDQGSLRRYLAEIRKFPLLTKEEEFSLAKRWQEDGDVDAAHQLVTSHLRLVAKIAMGYKGYGLPVSDLISEGNIGMMQAVKRFDPDRGFRLATYAMWWIRAAIQEYVLRSWSLVKVGTSLAQKKLFFNLQKMKRKLQDFNQRELTPENVTTIANALEVTPEEVISMDQRMGAVDQSLNATYGEEGETQFIDMLADDRVLHDVALAEHEELSQQRQQLNQALQKLNERERDILTARRLSEEPVTLEDLSQQYNISRERVRQIEARAFEKLQKEMTEANT